MPLLGQTAAINSIAFSPTGSEVATASDDGTVRVWQALGPELEDMYAGGKVESLALSATGAVVAFLDGAGVKVSDLGSSAGTAHDTSFYIPGSSPYDVVSVSPDGRYVADFAQSACGSSLCPSDSVSVYAVATGKPADRGSYPVTGAEAMTWSHDNTEIAVATNVLELVSLKTGQELAVNVPGAEQCGADGPPAFSADDSLVAWATRCGDVAVFRTVTGQQVSSFKVAGTPSGVAFNPAGSLLAVSTSNGALGTYSVLTGAHELSFPTASTGVSAIAYSPDGRYLVTTLLDNEAQVFDAATGQLERVDQDSSPMLVTPAFAANGEFATGDAAGSVEVWAECPACANAPLLMQDARSQVVSGLTPLEQAAKQ